MLSGGAVLLVVQLRRLPDPVAEFDIALAPGLDQGPDIVGVADHGGPVSVTVAGMAVCDAGRRRSSSRRFRERAAAQQPPPHRIRTRAAGQSMNDRQRPTCALTDSGSGMTLPRATERPVANQNTK